MPSRVLLGEHFRIDMSTTSGSADPPRIRPAGNASGVGNHKGGDDSGMPRWEGSLDSAG